MRLGFGYLLGRLGNISQAHQANEPLPRLGYLSTRSLAP